MLLNKQLKEKKFKKYHKIKKNGLKFSKIHLNKNNFEKNYSLKSNENGLITTKELNSINIILKKKLKKKEFKLKILLDFITTKKPIETRMGKGKGPLDEKVCWVNKGQTILTFSNINFKNKINILKSIKKKINLSTSIDIKHNNW